MSQTAEDRRMSQYLRFQVAGGTYAVSLLRVKEIIEYRPLTVVPMTPTCVRGVLNLRGSVVPVIDLALRFGLPPAPVGKRTCVVITEASLDGTDAVIGLVADAVSEVLDLARDALSPAPAFGTPVPVEYLQGLAQVGDGFVLLLDVDRVLDLHDVAAALSATNADAAAPDAAPSSAPPASPDGRK
jgi:purine-binding chemotaxis protein CheW